MTGYSTAAAGIASGLSVPLRPPLVTGANPRRLAAGVASNGGFWRRPAYKRPHAGAQRPLQAAGQAVSPQRLPRCRRPPARAPASRAPMVTSARPARRSWPSRVGSFGSGPVDDGHGQFAAVDGQGMTQPLSQLTQAPMQMGGALSGMMGRWVVWAAALRGLSARPAPARVVDERRQRRLLARRRPGDGCPDQTCRRRHEWWTDRDARGLVGTSPAADGSGTAGQNKPAAAARAGLPGAGTGTPMAWVCPDDADGRRAGDAAARPEREPRRGRHPLSVVLDEADAIPILTANGVVYTDGEGDARRQPAQHMTKNQHEHPSRESKGSGHVPD